MTQQTPIPLPKLIRQTLHRAADILERIQEGEPYTHRDIDAVLDDIRKALQP